VEPRAGLRLPRPPRPLLISHESIYRHLWRDKREGGTLHVHLRGARKRRRKRYGAYDSCDRLSGKRPISERAPEVETRERVGHWEADTVAGSGSKTVSLLSSSARAGWFSLASSRIGRPGRSASGR